MFAEADRLTTADLLAGLHGLEDAPWNDLRGKPITARWLANKLKPYGVKPSDHRFADGTKKGYLVQELHDVWARYGLKGNRGNKGNAPGRDVADVAHVAHREGANGSGVHTRCPECGRESTVDPDLWHHPTNPRFRRCWQCGKGVTPLVEMTA